jgi:hypothetical protein
MCAVLVAREIPRNQWRSYFDEFSRDLDPMRARMEVAGPALGDQVVAERLALTAIVYDNRNDILVIGLDAPGGLAEDIEHVIYQPQTIFLTSGDDGTTTFDVQDAEGDQTLIRLEPAA